MVQTIGSASSASTAGVSEVIPFGEVSFVYLLLSIVALPLSASSGPLPPLPPCWEATPSANIFYECRNFNTVRNALPCGVTNIGPCDLDYHPHFGCDLEIGTDCTGTWILYQWESNVAKNTPTMSKCGQLANSLRPCDLADPEDPNCPDECASGVCEFGCEPPGFVSPLSPETEELWGEDCLAYTLMELGWEDDPFSQSQGFFPVGAHMNPLLAAQSPTDLTLRGEMRWKMLATAGFSKLWTDRKGSRIEFDWQSAKNFNLCWQPQALIGSPRWEKDDNPATDVDESAAGFERRPVVVRCDGKAAWDHETDPAPGYDLYVGYQTEEEWLESGALMEQTLPLLRRYSRKNRFDLVCVTHEVADARRKLRAAAQGY